MLATMIGVLRRYRRWLTVLACALVIGFLIRGLQGVAMAFALLVLWRFLLLLVSLDPDKPRLAPRQNTQLYKGLSQGESLVVPVGVVIVIGGLIALIVGLA
jgi:hypothetical protein